MKVSTILDTDIGYDPDDLFALILLLKSKELKLDLIVTGDDKYGKRFIFVKKILELMDIDDVKVVKGSSIGSHRFILDEYIKGEKFQIEKDFVKKIKRVVDSSDKVVYIGIDGFTNLSHVIKKYPNIKKKLKIYQMGGAVNYSRRPLWVEHNVKMDVKSVKFVLGSSCDISLIMAQTTFNPELRIDNKHRIYRKLKASKNSVYKILVKHIDLYHKHSEKWPYMHDPLTVAEALGKRYVNYNKSALRVNNDGNIKINKIGPKVMFSKKKLKGKEFMNFLENRLF